MVSGKVGMYACGVTVYDHSHIGHAMQAIFFDVIRRYLEKIGYEVQYVRNYTDVDDKIIRRAQELGKKPTELADEMIKSCEHDLQKLFVRPANFEPKVSESIPEIIAMIDEIIQNDAAYATAEGDVYYRVRAKSDYGKLSNRNPDELRSGEREIVRGSKEDVLDFALWKADTTEGASWDSPWGRGRPGWHIECSAMAKKYLGAHFDIHGGGRDLIFPHHENEIAQSESANCCKYVNYWIHCGLMTIDKQKMSKSLGNHISIKDFLKDYPAEVLRLGILQNHYASNIDFSDSVFMNCHRRLFYVYRTLLQLKSLASGAEDGPYIPGFDKTSILESFHENMCNDFNTARALGDLSKEFKRANELFTGKTNQQKKNTAKAYLEIFREIGDVLGLFDHEPATAIKELKVRILPRLGLELAELEKKISERSEARRAKDFATSDKIRDELLSQGIEIMDTPEGTDWGIHYRGEE